MTPLSGFIISYIPVGIDLNQYSENDVHSFPALGVDEADALRAFQSQYEGEYVPIRVYALNQIQAWNAAIQELAQDHNVVLVNEFTPD